MGAQQLGLRAGAARIILMEPALILMEPVPSIDPEPSDYTWGALTVLYTWGPHCSEAPVFGPAPPTQEPIFKEDLQTQLVSKIRANCFTRVLGILFTTSQFLRKSWTVETW